MGSAFCALRLQGDAFEKRRQALRSSSIELEAIDDRGPCVTIVPNTIYGNHHINIEMTGRNRNCEELAAAEKAYDHTGQSIAVSFG